MNTVSEWIESCATYDDASFVFNPRNQQPYLLQNGPQFQTQQLQPQHPQQQMLQQFNCNSLTNMQHEINNDMLVAMTLASPSPASPSTTSTDIGNNNSISNSIFPMASLGVAHPEATIEYHDPSTLWPQLGINISNANSNSNGCSPFLGFPMISFAPSSISSRGQDLAASDLHLNSTMDIAFQDSSSSQTQQQLSSTPSHPPTPILASHASFAATVDEMTMNPMRAHEQFTAILYSWSHQLGDPINTVAPSNPSMNITTAPTNIIPSLSSPTSSPALSTSSSFTASSAFTAPPSPAPSMYSPSLLSPSFSKSSSSTSCTESSKNCTVSAHSFAPRSTSKLTRRISQAFALKPIPTSSSSLTSGPMVKSMSSRSSWTSSSVPPLTCHECRKRYANNSTLRRHLKIHAYARALALYRASNGDNTNKIEPHSPNNQIPMAHSLMTHGYDPNSDPNFKKPECVGCNKAFARRDTVILHIKNQKRKWDLLNAILPTLTDMVSSVVMPVNTMSVAGSGVVGAAHTSIVPVVTAKNRRSQRQRRSNPYRMVEKLWQSTLQRKGMALSRINSNNKGAGRGYSSTGGCQKLIKRNSDDAYFKGEEEEEEEEDDDDDEEDEEDNNGLTDDGWPDMEAISKMDSQTKLKWMMETMVLPPCWRERKVRSYTSLGVSEEKVLQ
ncbi:hypothetical protein BGX27_007634 [Mortierella sp. AM989]|nr:hypothetical protein BGX27_007634 [Mortierella sp. AM989]